MKKALAAQGFEGGTRGATESNQWNNAEKEALAQVMERHGIEWEQFGSHNDHLSVLDFKKQERQAEVKELEQSVSRLQKKQLDIAAAQKYVVQEKKTGRLERLLKAAEKTIAGLKAKLAEVTRERDELRSVRGFCAWGRWKKRTGTCASGSSSINPSWSSMAYPTCSGNGKDQRQSKEAR